MDISEPEPMRHLLQRLESGAGARTATAAARPRVTRHDGPEGRGEHDLDLGISDPGPMGHLLHRLESGAGARTATAAHVTTARLAAEAVLDAPMMPFSTTR